MTKHRLAIFVESHILAICSSLSWLFRLKFSALYLSPLSRNHASKFSPYKFPPYITITHQPSPLLPSSYRPAPVPRLPATAPRPPRSSAIQSPQCLTARDASNPLVVVSDDDVRCFITNSSLKMPVIFCIYASLVVSASFPGRPGP